jgi:hypothetical protein
MPLTSALLGQIDYYHPPKSTNTPFDTLIWVVILAAIFFVTMGVAHLARSREARKLAEAPESSPASSSSS